MGWRRWRLTARRAAWERLARRTVRKPMVSSDLRSNDSGAGGKPDEKRRTAARLLVIKSSGYLISTVSVVLLGIVSWKRASEEPLLMVCLIAGMATSFCGMALRWLSYEIEERRKAAGRD
jgi:hypothetical protein